MVGTVGRTDLFRPDLAEPLAHEMFRSLHRFADRADDLADGLAVNPAHPLLFRAPPRDQPARPHGLRPTQRLAGELDGGIDAWAGGGRPTERIPVLDAVGMAATVIDVRQANEHGHAAVSVLDGGPDTWAAATGQNLELGP